MWLNYFKVGLVVVLAWLVVFGLLVVLAYASGYPL